MSIRAGRDHLARHSTPRHTVVCRLRVSERGITTRQQARIDALAQMIDLLDLLDADCDLEVETDCCAAQDDMLAVLARSLGGPGDCGAYEPDQEWSAEGAEF